MRESQHRYLVITELFLPTKGGTTVWFSEVFRRLGGKGIHIVTADVPGAAEVDATHPNTIHRLKLRRVWWLKPESLLMYLKLFFTSLRLAITGRFEAFHAIRPLPEGLVAWAVARLTLHPVIVYNHGEEITTWGNGAKFKAMCFSMNHADRVVANSDYTRGELIRIGVDPKKITLINPGVDIERFCPGLAFRELRLGLGMQEGQSLILSVGRLQPRKGFDMVIRSLPPLLEQGLDVHYASIGIGDNLDHLQELAQELGVSDRVHFLGHVPPDDLPHWYNACDVFIMPNREIDGDTEGFGMVFVEASACGKPVIAGKAGGTGSAVIEDVTGLRVDGNKPEEVTKALARLLTDKELAARLGSQGHSRVVNELSWEAVTEKTASLKID
jgi:phosphatidylinositol alpha-1,6-mannosyltransferase